jgi:hypothetical protein
MTEEGIVSAEKFSLWQFVWTKRRGFLLFHAIVATVLGSVFILHTLYGSVATIHYRYIALVLLIFQATAFTLDLMWSVKDMRERERRRREQAANPSGDDDWW